MITAKLHARWSEYFEHWGAWIEIEIISISVNGRRLVLRHLQGTDNRGSHYGQAYESYDLIRDSQERKRFLRQFIGRVQISEELITALVNSQSNRIFRNGDCEFPIEDGRWITR